MRVLIVEDDEVLAQTLAKGLRRYSMSVDVFVDGYLGLEATQLYDYDVLILDRDLPGISGDEICRQLSKVTRRLSILMLTASSTVDDRVEGLGLGADDYLVKPFAFAELVARISALARRSNPVSAPLAEYNGITINTFKREAHFNGHSLVLRPKEFGVLEVLVGAQGGVVSAEELLDRVWDSNADPHTSAVKVTISRLREKLGDPTIIDTVTKAGYRIKQCE